MNEPAIIPICFSNCKLVKAQINVLVPNISQMCWKASIIVRDSCPLLEGSKRILLALNGTGPNWIFTIFWMLNRKYFNFMLFNRSHLNRGCSKIKGTARDWLLSQCSSILVTVFPCHLCIPGREQWCSSFMLGLLLLGDEFKYFSTSTLKWSCDPPSTDGVVIPAALAKSC